MKKLILSISLTCVASVSQANVCEVLFQDIGSTRIISDSSRGFYEVTELSMSKTELEALRREAQELRDAKPLSRLVTHLNKTATVDGNSVSIESKVGGKTTVYQKTFDNIRNANGYFEHVTGQYWIMTHNEGRVMVWNFTKNRLIDIELPAFTGFEGVAFDLSTNIFKPVMIIQYRKHTDGSEMVELMQMEIDLITGKEI